MLIVNADDFGRSREETDAVVTCYSEGRITSTSAMLFMRDSQRAAGKARELGIPVRLHLNLSEPFTSGQVSPQVAQAHARVVRFLRRGKYATVLYNPLLREQFRCVVDAQYEEFERVYGERPSYVDGHQHQHLCSNVLLDGLLPRGCGVRRSFSFEKGEKSYLNLQYRRMVDAFLARKHPLVDFFFALDTCLRSHRLGHAFAAARTATVELMAHPIRALEFNYLMSEAHLHALTDLNNEAVSSF